MLQVFLRVKKSNQFLTSGNLFYLTKWGGLLNLKQPFN